MSLTALSALISLRIKMTTYVYVGRTLWAATSASTPAVAPLLFTTREGGGREREREREREIKVL